METLWQDLRHGARMLRKSPGFAVVAILTLAIGIGANTAIFSVVDAVLLKPLAVQDPARLVYIEEVWQNIFPNLSVGNFADLRRQSASFSSLAASNNGGFNLATSDTSERVDGELVTADYFATFGVRPMLGRVFTADEDQPDHPGVVIIAEHLWRTHLHADPSIVGQSLRINGVNYTVVGVMPKSFDPLLSNTALWIPAGFNAQQLANHDNHYLSVIGRLKPGVSLVHAQAEADVIAQHLQQQFPNDDKDRGLRILPLTTTLFGDQRTAMQMLLAAVGFVLLIACANIANLQLARSRSRRKEMAVRAALGASPRRLVRQLLLESLVLGFVSGVVGVLLAFWGVSWIVAKGPAGVPRLSQSTVDAKTLGFACVVALLSSFLFGLAPAFRAASARLSEAFKEGIGTSSGGRDHVRSVLVVAEIALALMLMAGAGLLIRSAVLVSHLSPGFDTANLVVGRVGLPDALYHDPAVARHAFEHLIDSANALPGVESAATVSRAPLAGGWSSNGLIAEGKPLDSSSAVNSLLQIISPSYLSTSRLPLKAGRDFTPNDIRTSTLVAIVNETLARTMWPGQNPIGKRFACCESSPRGAMDPVWHEVVGVVGDVKARGLDQNVEPSFYIPLAQMPPPAWDWIGRTMDLVVRTKGGAFPANDLRAMVDSVVPGVPIYELSTMQQKIAGTLAESHFDTFLVGVFAAIALLLSSVGIYGVLSYVVSQRTRDIGIRMALGATPGIVMRDVLWYGLRLTVVGLALGIAGALAGTRLLSSILYGIRSTDGVTFAAASLILTAVALLASYLPARRATRVDPLVALHYE